MDIKTLTDRYLKKCEIKSYITLIEEASYNNREITLEDIDADTANIVDTLIRFWNKEDCQLETSIQDRIPIKIFINSQGGNLEACLTILNTIDLSKTPVHTIVIGMAYSAALWVAMKGHKRFAYKDASYMFHEGSISTDGAMDANKFKNCADFYKIEIERLKKILISNTKVTKEWYCQHQYDDVWLYAEEAKELGLVDEIIMEL